MNVGNGNAPVPNDNEIMLHQNGLEDNLGWPWGGFISTATG
jgi:hypothetical protein